VLDELFAHLLLLRAGLRAGLRRRVGGTDDTIDTTQLVVDQVELKLDALPFELQLCCTLLIHDEGLAYSRHYDQLYQHGSPMRLMRVSNLHHETAVRSLFLLQEIEPDTYERLVARIGGIDMAGKLGLNDYFPRELPFMFKSWLDYREHLLDTLVDDDYRPALRRKFAMIDRGLPPGFRQEARAIQVTGILTCDWEGAKLEAWYNSPQVWKERKAWQDSKRALLGTT
jgi:hypothetical protein